MGQSQTSIARARKQAERERLIVEAELELGLAQDYPEDAAVLDTKPELIVSLMKRREWTVEKVMMTYIRAACAAHRKTNCLTEIMFREALEDARLKDKALAAGDIPEGDFYGLPSSFKDHYNVISVDSSLGCSPHCFKPTLTLEEEASLVKLFRSAGGIPFCKTNVPQTMLSFEGSNPIFGATSNPYNSTRTSGGSSSGEAALVTLKGTPLGWGSDVGGSLRIPSAYSGCVGLKPVKGRWAAFGSRKASPGFEGIHASIGPMARTVEDLTFAARTAINLSTSGPINGEAVLPIPWRDVVLPERLKIGYWFEDGLIKTSPACVRAVEETVHALEQAGHHAVPYTPDDIPEALKIFVGLTSSEGYDTLLSNIGKDPMEPSMRLVTIGCKIPRFLHWIARKALRFFAKDELFASLLEASHAKTVTQTWQWTVRRDEYAAKLRKSLWEDEGFDCVICPVQAVPAIEHGMSTYLSPLALSTILFNVVDSTVGVLPVTRVVKADRHPEDFLKDSKGSWILERRVYGGCYDADKMEGLPVGVQVIGRAWEEERVLAAMSIIEKLVSYER